MDQSHQLRVESEAIAGMVALGGPQVIALSGGADSSAALWLAKQSGNAVRCIHISHRLPASPMMERAAREVANVVGVALEVIEVEPESDAEAELREVRYGALLDALSPGDVLITAHTADDQAETVLLNLLRGSGPDGLAGIPRRRGSIVRPLLSVSRHELRAIARRHELPFVDDPENERSDHLRNRVRHELMPLLETYNPAIGSVLRRTADNLRDTRSDDHRPVVIEEGLRGFRVGVGPMLALQPHRQRAVLRSILTSGRGPYPPTRDEVERAQRTLISGTTTEFAETPMRMTLRGPWLEFATSQEVSTEQSELVPGSTWAGFHFRIASWDCSPRLSKWTFVFSEQSLRVRRASGTDVIAMRSGSKRVQDAIREAGFDPAAHPVVTDASGVVVWIPGVRHTPWARVADKNYLVVVAEQDSEWAPSVR